MSKGATYTLRLSRSVMRAARETAAREGVSLTQLIATALAEKLSALRTEDLLAGRAARGDWDRVRAILDRVGTEPPRDGDELPPAARTGVLGCKTSYPDRMSQT